MKKVLILIIFIVLSFSELRSQCGYSAYFDGNDAKIEIPHSSSLQALQNTSVMTFEAWVKVQDWSATGVHNFVVFDKEWRCEFGPTYIALAIETGSTPVSDSYTTQNKNIWMHLAISYNKSTGESKHYINGNLTTTKTISTTGLHNNSYTMKLGYGPSGAVEYSKGWIDEFRIWNEIRTPKQIQDNMYCKLKGNEQNLVIYMPFDEGSGTKINDKSKNANNGTAYGGFSFSTDIPTQYCPESEAGDNVEICKGDSVQIGQSPLTGTSYSWFPTTGMNNGNIANPKVSPSVTTKYYLTANKSICNAIDSVTVTVRDKPKLNITGLKEVCLNQKAIYSTNVGDIESISWSVVNATLIGVSTTKEIDIVFKNKGQVKVKAVIKYNYGCIDSNEIDVNVNTIDKLPITGPQKICINEEVEYNSKSLDDITYSWNAFTGKISGSKSKDKVKVKYSDAGKDSLRLVVTNKSGCSDTSIIYIDIIDLPANEIKGNSIVCRNENYTYSYENFKNINFEWKIENGTFTTGTNTNEINVNWQKVGKGKLSLIYKNLINCADTVIMDIDIVEKVKPEIIGNIKACVDDEFIYTNVKYIGGESKWKLDGKDIASLTQDSVIINWDKPGNYKLVSINDFGSGCVDSNELSIEVFEKPSADILIVNDICLGDTLNLVFSRNPDLNYKFFIDSKELIPKSDTVNYYPTSAGKINLKVIVNNKSNCTSIKEYEFTVNPNPVNSINGSSFVIKNTPETYISSINNAKLYKWFCSGGIITNGELSDEVTIMWGNIGTAVVGLIIENEFGCKDTTELAINIGKTDAQIQGLNSVCLNDIHKYSTNKSENYKLEWSVKNGIILSDNTKDTIDVDWNTIGSQELILTLTDLIDNTVDTLAYTIEVHPLPNVIINGPKKTALGNIITYTSSNLNNNYKWSIIGGSIIGNDNAESINVSWSSAGNGKLKLIEANQFGCKDSIETNIDIFDSSLFILGDNSLCENEIVEYETLFLDYLDYKWIVDGGTIVGDDDSSKVIIQWLTAGNHNLKLTQINNSDNTISSIDINVVVNNKTDFTIIGNPIIEVNEFYTYNVISSENLVLDWQVVNADSIETNGDNANIRFKNEGFYKIVAIGENLNGCKDTVEFGIEVIKSKIPYQARLEIRKYESYAGETITVPILLNDLLYEDTTKSITISTNFYFNPTLLYPLDYTMVQVDDTSAYIELTNLPTDKAIGDAITEIKFRVGLGNAEECSLRLGDMQAVGGLADISVEDGNFKLLGICYEGGTRLLNPNKRSGIQSIVPNPAENIINVRADLTEKGKTEILIYNITGEIVKTIYSSGTTTTGLLDLSIDLNELGNGAYTVVLVTPTYVNKANLIIAK